MIKDKKEDEQRILKKLKDMSGYVFAVEHKVDKRCMQMFKRICDIEREFEKIDKKHEGNKYFV